VFFSLVGSRNLHWDLVLVGGNGQGEGNIWKKKDSGRDPRERRTPHFRLQGGKKDEV